MNNDVESSWSVMSGSLKEESNGFNGKSTINPDEEDINIELVYTGNKFKLEIDGTADSSIDSGLSN